MINKHGIWPRIHYSYQTDKNKFRGHKAECAHVLISVSRRRLAVTSVCSERRTKSINMRIANKSFYLFCCEDVLWGRELNKYFVWKSDKSVKGSASLIAGCFSTGDSVCSHLLTLVPRSRIFYPEDGGDTFLRNVGSHKIYTARHPRRRHSSTFPNNRQMQRLV
jgi:hypothetical protein